MKILITSDWHLGVRSNSQKYLDIFWEWLTEFLVPLIEKEKIDELVVLGDFYDDRNEINVKTENLSLDAISYLTSKCRSTGVKLITGNHDLYYRNTRDINSLKKFSNFEGVDVISKIEKVRVGNRNILYCPWLTDKKELVNYVSEQGQSDIAFGHFDINGFQMVRGVIEKNSWPQDFFNTNFLKAFSGHFHLRDEQKNIIYVGNPYQMQWGDYGNEKGVYVLNTETLQTRFIKNNVSPEYKKIYLSQIKKKQIDFNDLKGQFVQLILDDSFTDKVLEKIQEVISSKGPASFTVEGGNNKTDLDIEELQNKVSNPIEYLISYIGELKLDNGIDRDVLVKEVNEIYNRCLR